MLNSIMTKLKAVWQYVCIISPPSLKICICCSVLWFPIYSRIWGCCTDEFSQAWALTNTASTEASTCWKIRRVLKLPFCIFLLMRMVDLANLTLSPLINPMTNPFPHANKSCSSAQGRATLAQLGEKEDNGTCPGPRRKNNRHGSLWELFTSVHFHKDMWENSPAVLSSSQQHTVSIQRKHSCTSMLTHDAQRWLLFGPMIIWLLTRRSATHYVQKWAAAACFLYKPANLPFCQMWFVIIYTV